MSEETCTEAMRIIRTVECEFPTGPSKRGSAFLAGENGVLVTCAHVLSNEVRERANKIRVTKIDGDSYRGEVGEIDFLHDIATIETGINEKAPKICTSLPNLGRNVIFAGQPQGISKPSVFPGMVSGVGSDLLSRPRCELIQISGMVNNGNSGGPVLDTETNKVIGVITSKYVPLLQEIDKLTEMLEEIPQFPSDVGIGNIDFARFVNLTISSMWQLGAVLRLVQVGTGWAVPVQYFTEIGVI